ncbi:MAG: response regulator [Elusimicrobia bacterium]|nr:response regulator [Elusimicrobiota bacterium]
MKARILVADDDKSMLGLYDRIFAATGYAIAKAESFSEAVRLMEETAFDLLITDFSFPDGIGTDLARLFSERRGKRGCLLVTGSVSPSDKLRLKDVNRLIEKPFKVEEFMTAVSEALA